VVREEYQAAAGKTFGMEFCFGGAAEGLG